MTMEYFPGLMCVPPEVQLGQEVKVVVKYLNDHPEKLHTNAVPLVQGALEIAFPCSPSKP